MALSISNTARTDSFEPDESSYCYNYSNSDYKPEPPVSPYDELREWMVELWSEQLEMFSITSRERLDAPKPYRRMSQEAGCYG